MVILRLDSSKDEGDSSVSKTAIRVASLAHVEFNLGLVLSEIRVWETGYFIQSLKKNPFRQCFSVSDKTDLFWPKSIWLEELMVVTDASDYSSMDPVYLGIFSPYIQEVVIKEASFKVGYI